MRKHINMRTKTRNNKSVIEIGLHAQHEMHMLLKFGFIDIVR